MNFQNLIPCDTLVVGYYVFCLSLVCRLYLCPSALHFCLIKSIYQWISFKFCICICTNKVSLWIVDGQISIIYHRVVALVSIQKMVFASSFFTVWSIMMKFHINNQNFVLARKFVFRVICPCPVQNNEKININSELKQFF